MIAVDFGAVCGGELARKRLQPVHAAGNKDEVVAPEARLGEALVLWADANQRVEKVLGSSAAALRIMADDVASPEFLEAYEARGSLRS
jgi:hypothetical protein